jgi:hypothetical protein
MMWHARQTVKPRRPQAALRTLIGEGLATADELATALANLRQFTGDPRTLSGSG